MTDLINATVTIDSGQVLGLVGSQSALAASVSSILFDIAVLLLVLLGPFVVFALIIHWLERRIQTSLAERFGWKSVLWTGWLGTPIHELSHAFMCKVFRHDIVDIALFEPDRESGRLGYVRHTWKVGNWFEEVGNVFIGIAPLIGGSISLASLLWLFFPDAAKMALEIGRTSEADAVGQTLAIVQSIFGNILNLRNFGSIRFWAFIYLVLCVSSHMAPSRSDYQGVGRGILLLMVPLLVIAAVTSLLVSDIPAFSRSIAELFSPLFAVLLLAIALCSLATIIVNIGVRFFAKRYNVR